MRLSPLVIIVSLFIMGAVDLHAQNEGGIPYEVVMHLPIEMGSGATWSPDGSQLAVIVWPTIQIWDMETRELLVTIPDALINSVKWSPDGNMLAGVQSGGNIAEARDTILIWDAATGEVIQEMSPPHAETGREVVLVRVDGLSWQPNGDRIATGSEIYSDRILVSDSVLVWDLQQDDNPQTLIEGYPQASGEDYVHVRELDWSQNGRWLLGSGYDRPNERLVLRLWDAETGETISTFYPVVNPMWGPNDEQFAGLTIVDDGYLTMQDARYLFSVWDTETGELISSFKAQKNYMAFTSWNLESNFIAGANWQGYLMLWNVETGTRYTFPELETLAVSGIEWRPNSNQLAIADLDLGVTILEFNFSSLNR